MALQPTPDQKIDRQTTTPFLLRLYYRSNAFHSPSEFTTVPPPSSLQQQSLQIYTWPTCTLSELTSLFSTALPHLIPTPSVGTRIGYRLLFPDTRSVSASGGEGPGKWLSKELGSVIIGAGEDYEDAQGNGDAPDALPGVGKLSGDANKTLADARFVIGDYISCAIFPPLPDGSVAPLPPSDRGFGSSGRGMGGPRDGYGRGGYGGRMENGHGGGYRGGRQGRAGFAGDRDRDRGFGAMGVPSGEWRRGERIPEGPGGGSGRPRARPRPY